MWQVTYNSSLVSISWQIPRITETETQFSKSLPELGCKDYPHRFQNSDQKMIDRTVGSNTNVYRSSKPSQRTVEPTLPSRRLFGTVGVRITRAAKSSGRWRANHREWRGYRKTSRPAPINRASWQTKWAGRLPRLTAGGSSYSLNRCESSSRTMLGKYPIDGEDRLGTNRPSCRHIPASKP